MEMTATDSIIKIATARKLACKKCDEEIAASFKYCPKCGAQNLKVPKKPGEIGDMARLLRRFMDNPMNDPTLKRELVGGAMIGLLWALGEERNPLNDIAAKR